MSTAGHPYDPTLDRRLGHVREAACLAHVVPGVSLRIPLTNGEHLFVSHVCLGADLDPCQLRSALVVDRNHGLRLLSDTIVDAEIVSGLAHLGGGIYQRTDGATIDERWFTSTLHPNQLLDTLRNGAPDDATTAAPTSIDVVVKPDTDLGVSAVCVRCADPADAGLLDEIALHALATCLVAELVGDLDHTTHH